MNVAFYVVRLLSQHHIADQLLLYPSGGVGHSVAFYESIRKLFAF